VQAVVSKIMQRAQTLLNCERCLVVLDKQHPGLSEPLASAATTGLLARASDVISPSPVRSFIQNVRKWGVMRV